MTDPVRVERNGPVTTVILQPAGRAQRRQRPDGRGAVRGLRAIRP